MHSLDCDDEKERWLLTQKYFSIKFRLMFQLAIDSIKVIGLAQLTYGSTTKKAFPKVIQPRLEVLVFLFLLFHCYVPFHISQAFQSFLRLNLFLASLSCYPLPSLLKKGMLIFPHNLCH